MNSSQEDALEACRLCRNKRDRDRRRNEHKSLQTHNFFYSLWILLGIWLTTILARYVSDKLMKILSITNNISGEVVSIIYDEHHKCPVCDWKVSMAVPQDIVKCSNCSAKFKVSKAKKQSMAKVQIKDNNGEMHKIKMFTNILSTLLNLMRLLKNISCQWTTSKFK
uniref:Uncharacterized protein n=1 Tax=Amphimedon queenslandica TaxID=400682 RepID=A0A1X7TEN2_AMPQE